MDDSHKQYLFKEFISEIDLDILSKENGIILRRYGSLMEALVERRVAPVSEIHRRLLAINNGDQKAESEFEKAWVEYRLECLYEVAMREEKKLGESSSTSYEAIVKLIHDLACMGHPKSLAWLRSEEQVLYVSHRLIPLGQTYQKPANILDGNTQSSSYGGRAQGSSYGGRTQGSFYDGIGFASDSDWSNSFDDMDSGSWGEILGGPDID